MVLMRIFFALRYTTKLIADFALFAYVYIIDGAGLLIIVILGLIAAARSHWYKILYTRSRYNYCI